MAGGGDPRAFAGGDRYPGVLVVFGGRGFGLQPIHGKSGGQSGGHHAVEGTGAEVALPAQGFSTGEECGMERRAVGDAVRNAEGGGTGGAVFVEQPAAGALHGAAAAGAVGDDSDEEAARAFAAFDRSQGAVWAGPRA